MFFQVHRDGNAVDGNSYPTLEEASAALQKAKQGGQVAEVDASDRNHTPLYSAGVSHSGAQLSARSAQLNR